MVWIHVKHGEDSDQKEFLYDCASTSPIDEIAPELSRISNLQSRIDRLALELEPRLDPSMAMQKVRRLTISLNDSVSIHRALAEAKSYASKDQVAAVSIHRALAEAKSYASKDQVVYNKPLSYHVLRNHVQVLERELNSVSQFQKLLSDIESGGEDSSELRWAGKVLDRSKRLCDYIGTNEKTKIIIKLRLTDSILA